MNRRIVKNNVVIGLGRENELAKPSPGVVSFTQVLFHVPVLVEDPASPLGFLIGPVTFDESPELYVEMGYGRAALSDQTLVVEDVTFAEAPEQKKMYVVHKIHEQWLNGNRKDAIRELDKLEADKVQEFMGYLSAHHRAAAVMLALSYKDEWK
jgi:hypothetical protein